MHPVFASRTLHSVVMAAMLAFSMTPVTHALSVTPRSFDEVVALADLVIVGTVYTQQSRFDAPDQAHISTYVTLHRARRHGRYLC